jgi:hypothetical protein
MAGQICVVHIDECIDGTAYGHCSLEQPKYCDAGVLVDNASKCGCPGGYKQLNQSCLYARCKDGTLFGKCSDANPFYCTETGELIYKASKCGCENFSSPYIITVADEQCLPLYYSNHDKYVDTPETQYDGSLRITINSIKLRKPDANGVEVLEVDLVAKNIGNQQASIYCWTSMHVIDYAGREYDGKMASGFGDSLNPGLSTSGKCLFEMSSPAAPYKIVFEPLFGGKTDYIISRP